MARPRREQRDPLRRLLAAWAAGEDVEEQHRDHLVALARIAVREGDALEFSTFESMAGAMAVRLYARSLATQDNLTLARCLGELLRSLRSLRLLNTASHLGQGRSRRRQGRGSLRDVCAPPPRRIPPGDDGEGEADDD